jgi:hypothetical protein
LPTIVPRPASATSPESHAAVAAATAHGYEVVRKLGSGRNQKAYTVRPQTGGGPERVLKIFRFQTKYGGRADRETRGDLARIAVTTTRLLRQDASFKARFGDIIPHMDHAGTGGTLQDFARPGVGYASLSPAQQAVASAEANEAMRIATAVLGGLPISKMLGNFVFDPNSGRIASWFDHLSHSNLPLHLQIARQNGFHRAP